MFTGLRSQLDFGDAILGKILSQDHDLVKLKSVIDWKRINALYEKCFSSDRGNATKPTQLVIGLILLRHLLRKPDRLLIEELHVNLAIMNFCSVSPWEVRIQRTGRETHRSFNAGEGEKTTGIQTAEE